MRRYAIKRSLNCGLLMEYAPETNKRMAATWLGKPLTGSTLLRDILFWKENILISVLKKIRKTKAEDLSVIKIPIPPTTNPRRKKPPFIQSTVPAFLRTLPLSPKSPSPIPPLSPSTHLRVVERQPRALQWYSVTPDSPLVHPHALHQQAVPQMAQQTPPIPPTPSSPCYADLPLPQATADRSCHSVPRDIRERPEEK